MALQKDNIIHDEITPKDGGKFKLPDGPFAFTVVDANPFISYPLDSGATAVANGDFNIVLYRVDNSPTGIAGVVALLTEAELRANFDNVPA